MVCCCVCPLRALLQTVQVVSHASPVRENGASAKTAKMAHELSSRKARSKQTDGEGEGEGGEREGERREREEEKERREPDREKKK